MSIVKEGRTEEKHILVMSLKELKVSIDAKIDMPQKLGLRTVKTQWTIILDWHVLTFSLHLKAACTDFIQ